MFFKLRLFNILLGLSCFGFWCVFKLNRQILVRFKSELDTKIPAQPEDFFLKITFSRHASVSQYLFGNLSIRTAFVSVFSLFCATEHMCEIKWGFVSV